jgi:hypothetical protein
MLRKKFYFQTIRKIIASVVTTFSDIYVQRYSNNGNQGTSLKSIRVPVRYIGADKTIVLNREKTNAQESTRTKISYPRIGVQMIQATPDRDRKLPSMNRSNYIGSGNSVGKFLSQLSPNPIDIHFELTIEGKYMNDMLQIFEQIIPFFTPSLNLVINDIPELQLVKDIPLILSSVSFGDAIEGLPENERIITWKLDLVCKAYVYPPISDSKVIKKVIATLYNNEAMTETNEIITVSVDPLDALPTDNYDIVTEIDRP